VEDQEQRLLLLSVDLLLGVSLVLAEQFWVKLDISWLVNTVNVSESSSDREIW